MSAITTEQILYMTKLAQRDLGRGRWTDLASDIQEYLVLRRLLKKERVGFASGTAIQGNVMTMDNGAAKFVGLYGVDTYQDVDGFEHFFVPWTHVTTNWSYDRRLVKMASGKAKIVDIVKAKRAQAMISLAKKLELAGWTKPADSSDVLQPYGIPYWAVKNATVGFNGGNPAGFPNGAGNLDSTKIPQWQNYTGGYKAFTKDDLVFMMRECYARLHFMCPIDIPDYRRGADRYELFMNLKTRQQLETIGEKQNDNLGRDIARMDGRTVFNGNPMTWAPYVDADTDDPIYFINWSVFYFVFLEGEYMVEDPAEKAPGQHTVIKADIDLTCNTRCVDRRRIGVLHRVAA